METGIAEVHASKEGASHYRIVVGNGFFCRDDRVPHIPDDVGAGSVVFVPGVATDGVDGAIASVCRVVFTDDGAAVDGVGKGPRFLAGGDLGGKTDIVIHQLATEQGHVIAERADALVEGIADDAILHRHAAAQEVDIVVTAVGEDTALDQDGTPARVVNVNAVLIIRGTTFPVGGQHVGNQGVLDVDSAAVQFRPHHTPGKVRAADHNIGVAAIDHRLAGAVGQNGVLHC